MQSNIFLPRQIEYLSNSVIWKTIREYQRSHSRLAGRQSMSSQSICASLQEAIDMLEAELRARGFETSPVLVAAS